MVKKRGYGSKYNQKKKYVLDDISIDKAIQKRKIYKTYSLISLVLVIGFYEFFQ